MRKSEDAVTPMPSDFDDIRYLVGDSGTLEQMKKVPALPVFSESAVAFLGCLSERLMHNDEAKNYADVIAYAFWIRRASLNKESMRYRTADQRLGRGIAFQITPSNIPVQFAVSMTYALIAGNASVVRVSDKDFEQVSIICRELQVILRDVYPEMAPYICIIRYDHKDKITQMLTDMCDIRMIWGGDATIEAIRKISVIKPRCIDLGFADRYSIAVIDADDYLSRDAAMLANDFYNDTYFSDQNACSSPRLIIWIGNRIAEAKEIFWRTLENIVSHKYAMDPICSSEKLLKLAMCADKHAGIKEIKNNNLLVRIALSELYEDVMDYKGNCGFFFEYDACKLQDIIPVLKKECQTIAYIGNIEDELRRLVVHSGVAGVDRIVPVGHAGDITFIWDGLDMPNVLSRQIGNS